MAVFGLGLAALGRPEYLTVGHGGALGGDRSAEGLRKRCEEVCDAAWAGGVRWFDAARSYGLAEDFLAGWLERRGIAAGEVTVSSKWGYAYTADWQPHAQVQEVKDHSAAALARQWPRTEALLGPWLRLYAVHSATLESGVLDDAVVLRELAGLPVPAGLSLSGPRQADTLRKALEVRVDGRPVFSAVQATWNVLEPSAGAALAEAKAAGWTVVVKEALANGLLAAPGPATARLGPRPDMAALAAALSQPWADVVLSGAVTAGQLRANLAAMAAEPPDPGRYAALAVDPPAYWADRAAMKWT
ncbi:aldo/keto reductase [Actinacidiphila paucisporea]|uniref:Predicted oxidoreductase n=1 Tax=Actinacidiphila paucisporea TaxID=310782 RepID=A0A1M7MXG2_9ACTN|nr:aldo/keto reductase [Actinacidiphila paucisporea]SHM95754.1 Predicted oxidoreductase [Actinacidiphila paucisporea]